MLFYIESVLNIVSRGHDRGYIKSSSMHTSYSGGGPNPSSLLEACRVTCRKTSGEPNSMLFKKGKK